jgi:hypothetical protein
MARLCAPDAGRQRDVSCRVDPAQNRRLVRLQRRTASGALLTLREMTLVVDHRQRILHALAGSALHGIYRVVA